MKCFACEKEITNTTWYAPDKEKDALVICSKCYELKYGDWAEHPDCDCCGGTIDDHFNMVNDKTICDDCLDTLEEQEEEIVIPEEEKEFHIIPAKPYKNQIGLC
jgi:hypothetical protein